MSRVHRQAQAGADTDFEHALTRLDPEIADDGLPGCLEDPAEYAIVYARVARIDTF
jgi:hypothetical protein